MIEKILSLAMESGVIAALFTGLLVYVLRDTKQREQKYQEMIAKLHDTLKVVKEIREDVLDIKKTIRAEKKSENKKEKQANEKTAETNN